MVSGNNQVGDHKKLGSLAILAAGISFGTTGTAQTLFGKNISPLAIGSSRLFIGAIALSLIARRLRIENPVKIRPIYLIISVLGMASYQLAFFSSVRLTGVAISTLTALGSAPIFTGIVAYIVAREKPTRVWFSATVLTTIGIVLLNFKQSDAQVNFLGVLLALLSGLGFAIFNVVSRMSLNSGVTASQLMAKTFMWAAILVFPLCFIDGLAWMGTAKGAGLIIWLGVATTGLGYTFYGYGLKRVHSSTASTLVLSEPATATLLSVTVLGNTLMLNSWLGIATIIAGLIYLAMQG